MVEHFLEIWEGAGSKQGMAVLLRSAASNSYAAAKMREAFLSQVMPFITASPGAGLISKSDDA